MDTLRKKTGVALLSVVSNTTLVVLKLIVGFFIGSVSVISEAIHSGVDLVAAIIAFIAVRRAGRPADQDHAFGHGKIENVSGTVEAILIFFAAGWIIYEAAHKLIAPQPLEDMGWGIAVMAGSAAANFFVSKRLFAVGTETDSVALKADAWHLRTDVYTSLGVMTGLTLYWLGRKLFPSTNLAWIDPVAAIIVALLIIKAAWELTIESARDLMDARLPDTDELVLDEVMKTLGPKLCGYHHLRSRKSGPYRFYEVHMVVDPEMTVAASHVMADAVVKGVKERYPESHVIVHVEPCTGPTCPDHCREHCFTPDRQGMKR